MAPALASDQLHSLEHGLVEDEYENFLLHSDISFRNDNGTLFGYLEEATRGTTFASSIKIYERTCNGCAAWMALNTQHAGDRKWRDKLKTVSAYVSGTKWDGSTNITIERHIGNCSQAYINL